MKYIDSCLKFFMTVKFWAVDLPILNPEGKCINGVLTLVDDLVYYKLLNWH